MQQTKELNTAHECIAEAKRKGYTHPNLNPREFYLDEFITVGSGLYKHLPELWLTSHGFGNICNHTNSTRRLWTAKPRISPVRHPNRGMNIDKAILDCPAGKGCSISRLQTPEWLYCNLWNDKEVILRICNSLPGPFVSERITGLMTTNIYRLKGGQQ